MKLKLHRCCHNKTKLAAARETARCPIEGPDPDPTQQLSNPIPSAHRSSCGDKPSQTPRCLQTSNPPSIHPPTHPHPALTSLHNGDHRPLHRPPPPPRRHPTHPLHRPLRPHLHHPPANQHQRLRRCVLDRRPRAPNLHRAPPDPRDRYSRPIPHDRRARRKSEDRYLT